MLYTKSPSQAPLAAAFGCLVGIRRTNKSVWPLAPPLRVVRVRSNGKRDFDRRDKRQLVEACLRPGVSVSGMALKVGINTNQLRKWIGYRITVVRLLSLPHS
ncbi:hypothetical protein D9M68_100290 [compost metagenome]